MADSEKRQTRPSRRSLAALESQGMSSKMDERQRQEEQICKQVACEERAFHVVLRLLENPITEDYLKDAGQLITASHYADVVEERSIAKLCGYPLCGNSLGKVPKHKYRISSKSNMVFDLTERKKFCSNYCLKASQYFEKQIVTSPIWAREKEPKVNFEFLRSSEKSCSVGDAVFLPLPQTELKKEVDHLKKLDQGTDSKQKDGGKEDIAAEDQSAPSSADPEHATSNLLSDIVDRIAEVKVSYTGEVEGINVDFSDEKASREGTLRDSGNIKQTDSGEVTLKLDKCEDFSKSEGSAHQGSGLEIKTVQDCNDDNRTASDEVVSSGNLIEPKDIVVDNLCYHTDCQPQCPLVQSKQESEETVSSVNKGSPQRASVPESTSTSTKGPLPGESKEDYVMRLLNRKKHLLGQLADIQQSEMSERKAEATDTRKAGVLGKHVPKSNVVDSDEDDDEDIHQPSKTEDRKVIGIDIVAEEKPVEKMSSLPVKPTIQEVIPQETETKKQISSPSLGEKGVSKLSSKKPSVKLNPLNAVAKVMEEWVTRDSLKYLGVCKTDDSVTQPSNFDSNYALLCQKVSAEEKSFERLLGEESVGDSVSDATRPVPDFKKLETETKEFELKVKEFYKGTTGGPGKKIQDKTDSSPVRIVRLPLVDSHDQMTIRRKIVLDRLNKVIPDLLSPLQLSIQDVSHLVRELVYTFSFTSQNILFKPGQWSLVGILLMKMLSLKSKKIDTSFKEGSALKYFSIILSGIGHKTEDLDEIIRCMACLNLDS